MLRIGYEICTQYARIGTKSVVSLKEDKFKRGLHHCSQSHLSDPYSVDTVVKLFESMPNSKLPNILPCKQIQN
ncbi:hypothetical protein Leryth_024676, partial [Lithospermum erythrorhizon]